MQDRKDRSDIALVAEPAANEMRRADRLEQRPAYDKTDALPTTLVGAQASRLHSLDCR